MKKILFLATLALAYTSISFAQFSKRWYSYSDYAYNAYTTAGGAMQFVNAPMWHTPNAKTAYGSSYDTIAMISVGTTFAPRLAGWNNVATWGSTIKVGPTDVFTIDSVRIFGVYQRNNSKTAVRDTIRMSFVTGNGLAGSNLPSQSAAPVGYGPVDYLAMAYDTTRNIATRMSTSLPLPYVQTLVLSNTDTASFFERAIRLTTPVTVAAGYMAGMSLSFRSGDATYTPYDTINYTSGNRKYGMFRPIIGFKSLGSFSPDWADYDPLDSNAGYFKLMAASWAGQYLPQWMLGTPPVGAGSWTASQLQLPVIDFHIDCPACQLNDVITGTYSVCVSSSTALAHSAPGGTWASSNTAIATVTSGGTVNGISAGTVTITYAIGGNKAYTTFTVHPVPAPGVITGPADICEGSATLYTTTGTSGTWSSSATSTAVVTSGLVTGLSTGTATISFTSTTVCGTLSATKAITVNALPDAGSITGSSTICIGSSSSLTSTEPGGTWAGTTGNATVSSSGSVTGATEGPDVIVYTVTNLCGSAVTAKPVTVNALPASGTITGFSSVCIGSNITLTPSEPGGTWAASNGNATVNAAGIVTGVSAGTVDVSYTNTNTCGSASTGTTITVNDCALSVSNVSGTEVMLYPNPVVHSFTISSADGIRSLSISNLMGQEILKNSYDKKEVSINIGHLPSGIYMLRVNDQHLLRITKQ